MSEENEEVEVVDSQLTCGNGYVVSHYMPDSIIGRILQIIEVMGLKENQEKQAKSLIKISIRELFSEQAIFISSKRHDEIRNEYWKKKKESERSEKPMEAI